MSLLHRGFLYVAAAAAFAVPSLIPRQQVPAPAPIQSDGVHTGVTPLSVYTPDAIEAYLSMDQIAWIRPGVKIKINSVTVGSDKKPVVDFNLTDSLDQPLDRAGKVTPGPVTPAFIMCAWDPAVRYYIPYTGTATAGVITTPGRDRNGAYTDLDIGHYTFKFSQAIPANHDVGKTITIGVYATRDMTGILDKNYYADNVFYDFRTDGAVVAPGTVWNNMAVAKACNKCHDPLAPHGGTRRDVKMCVLCHSDKLGTNGEANAKVFYHKLHMGKHLPSVVAGGSYLMAGNDYSTVGWPGNNVRAPYDCTTCHETSAAEKDVWYTRPSITACGSCHDDVNFTTGENHPAGPAADGTCATCHQPQGDLEFDASIIGAHTIPEKSKQLKGLTAAIVSVTNVGPGMKPTVVFKFKNGDGSAVDGSKLTRFGPIYAGPTTSYTTVTRETTRAASAVFDATAGTTTYTFAGAIPTTATGSLVFTGDFSRNVSLKRGDGKADIVVREAAFNPITYVALNGGAATPRRKVVDIANCNVCHGALMWHGNSRQTVEECVICHNPTADDGRTPLPESISEQRFIHRIHSGTDLTQEFTVSGTSFNDVRFPGDRRNCAKCHVTTAGDNGGPTYSLPIVGAVDDVITQKDYFSPQGPGQAACLGCHDTRDAAAHAYLNMAPFGEACGTCHASAGDWAVEKVHAR